MPSGSIRRWALAGCSIASAICLVAGLFLVPNIVQVDRLECRLGDVCLPRKTPGMMWEFLPLPLAYLTLGVLCWVVLASLAVTGLTMLSRNGVPRWLRLTYLVGSICLTGAFALDAVDLFIWMLPGPGMLLVLAGLLLLALAQWRMWSAVPRRGGTHGLAIGSASER